MNRWWIIPTNLEWFRGPGVCEACGKRCKNTEPHHIFRRGVPPGDVRINLVRLGSTVTMECECHSKHHSSDRCRLTRDDMIAMVVLRERRDLETIENALLALKRLGKFTTQEQLEEYKSWMYVGNGCIVSNSILGPLAPGSCSDKYIEGAEENLLSGHFKSETPIPF